MHEMHSRPPDPDFDYHKAGASVQGLCCNAIILTRAVCRLCDILYVIFVEPKGNTIFCYFQQLLSIPDAIIVAFGDGMNYICMFGQGWRLDCD